MLRDEHPFVTIVKSLGTITFKVAVGLVISFWIGYGIGWTIEFATGPIELWGYTPRWIGAGAFVFASLVKLAIFTFRYIRNPDQFDG